MKKFKQRQFCIPRGSNT